MVKKKRLKWFVHLDRKPANVVVYEKYIRWKIVKSKDAEVDPENYKRNY